MFDKILIANRGEAALRIMRSAREMGVKTVAVYSAEDFGTQPVKYADESIAIGSADPADSYLSIKAIIDAARATGADAIHPGYGLLAENAELARACAMTGFTFIGPDPDCIERMGDRAFARSVMRSCGVPVVPGSDDIVVTAEDARDCARRLGYPVLIKPAAANAANVASATTAPVRGVRLVRDPANIEAAYASATAAAREAYGSEAVYIEKYVPGPRHIEVQVLGDAHNNRVALCERDCSIQRRYRKLVEEAPSPAVTDDLRRAISVAAVKAVRALDYRGAGTVEFLLAPDGRFYFEKMTTCLAAEHPVTELITGVDIVKEQIRIAAGEPMGCADRSRFAPFGHAIELHINAEDPDDGFSPCPGLITRFESPAGPGVRVDTHVRVGSHISPHFDPLIAKLVVYGQDRADAIARGRRALDEFVIEGVKTSIPFHRRVLDNEVFCEGQATIDFFETQMGDLL